MIGQNLKSLRIKKTKLSQQDMADALSIERNTYARWENNDSDIKADYIPKLADLLGVQIHELFEDSKPLSINDLGNEYKDRSSFNGAVIILTDKDMVEKVLRGLEDRTQESDSK
jgi:transcriptional regulator with XRE-family HTH domain